MAGSACCACAQDNETHSGDEYRTQGRCSRIGPNFLRAMEPAWENIIRDWVLPLNLDTNHGYAKEQVVTVELAKRQAVAQGRAQRLQRLAQACRVRLGQLKKQADQLEAHGWSSETRRSELLIQI